MALFPIASMLVGGLEHEFYFSHHIGNFMIPTDEVIFFRGVGIEGVGPKEPHDRFCKGVLEP